MKSTIRRRAVIVGLFLFFGLVILVAGILTIGNLHNSFVRKFTVTTIFDEVNGLQPGNNIWFSGLKIGTVSTLEFYGKSQVRVSMKIDRAAQPYIRKNAKAKIGSDGLIGNKIVVIFGGNDSTGCIVEGDILTAEKALSTDDMMITLQENNRNILAITSDFRAISKKILEGQGTVGKLLMDDSLYNHLDETVTGLKRTVVNAEALTASLSGYAKKIDQPGSLTHDLVSDTVVFATLRATVVELQRIAVTAADLATSLKEAGKGLNNPESAVGTLLHDRQAGADIKSTLKNLESSMQKLNEDLEALQHSFLLKGYFKKKDR